MTTTAVGGLPRLAALRRTTTPEAPASLARALKDPAQAAVAANTWKLVAGVPIEHLEETLIARGLPMAMAQEVAAASVTYDEAKTGVYTKGAPEHLYQVARFIDVLRMASRDDPQVLEQLGLGKLNRDQFSDLDHFLFNGAVACTLGTGAAVLAGVTYDGLIQGVGMAAVKAIKKGGAQGWQVATSNWKQAVGPDLQGARWGAAYLASR